MQVYKFYQETGTKLCRYDIPPETYQVKPPSDWSKKGPCPQLPIHPRYDIDSKFQHNRLTHCSGVHRIKDALDWHTFTRFSIHVSLLWDIHHLYKICNYFYHSTTMFFRVSSSCPIIVVCIMSLHPSGLCHTCMLPLLSITQYSSYGCLCVIQCIYLFLEIKGWHFLICPYHTYQVINGGVSQGIIRIHFKCL